MPLRTSYARSRPTRTRKSIRTLGFIAVPLVLLATAAGALLLRPVPRAAHADALTGLRVQGNQLQDAAGQPVRLLGVNRSGSEYACIQGWGIFDGPGDAASVQAMAAWHVNSVRVPLNEDCWLGINGVPAAYAGANYQSAIVSYVNLLHQYGIYAELSLIWGAPGSNQATYQPGAPDEDHSPAFWASLASAFKNDSNVVLAPWGETIVDWNCFLNGGVCEATYGSNNTPYTTAGMQQAVNVMRGAGYNGVIAIPCIDYANDCSDSSGSWLRYEPSDPDHNLIAEAHVYGKNTCDTTACFNQTMAPIAATVPLIFGETGETYDGSDCNNSSSYISSFMNWADAHNVSYEAWTWDTWGSCNLSLISSYNGTPAGVYGTYVQQHLQAEAGGSGGGPKPTDTATATATATAKATQTLTPSPSPTPTSPPKGSFVGMGFAIGWQMPTSPPWGDITQEDLFALQTTNGTTLDTHFLSNVNVPAFVQAAHQHNVQAMITIGGSSDQNWQHACTGGNQAGFVQNLVNYMRSNGFDGIDLDIEDALWASQGPPSSAMTACIEAISTAAKAVKTQAGNTPRISADVITNWEGPWFTPSQADVDQFNLMTYGDTTGGSLQADVQATERQGLPAGKLVPAVDVIDNPSTSNQCGPFASYAQANGLMGAFVWDESTDEQHSYTCFNQLAPYVGSGGPAPTPPPTPTNTPPPTPTNTPPPTPTNTPPPTPTNTPPSSPSPSPSPSPTPGGDSCTAPTFSFGAQSASASQVTAGHAISFTTSFTASCATTGLVDFQVFTANGKRIWETWQDNQQLTGQSQTFGATWKVPASQAPGGYYVSIGVFSPGWTQLWAWKHQAAIFSVASAGPTCASTNTSGPTIHFVGAATTPDPASPGTRTHLSVTFVASCAIFGLVDYAVYDSTGHLVYQTWLDNRWLDGQQQTFSVGWKVPTGQAPGMYHLSLGVFSPGSTGWSMLYGWDNAAAPLVIK